MVPLHELDCLIMGSLQREIENEEFSETKEIP
jgi:hypothetical protein